MLVSAKATAQKVSSAKSARREKVAIGIHNWAIVGRKSARCRYIDVILLFTIIPQFFRFVFALRPPGGMIVLL
jgi:hypothetical protein